MNPDYKAAHIALEFAHVAPIISCRFHPKGQHVFGTSEDRAIIRWDLDDARKKAVFTAHDSWVWALAFSPDGQTLVSAGGDDTLMWWPALSEKPSPLHKITAHKGWIRAVAVSPDGKLVASGGNDRVVKLWNFADGKLVRELPGHELDIYSLIFHPSGNFILSGDLLGKVHQWEVATGKLVRTFDAKDLHHYDGGQQVHYGGVRGLALSANGKQLAAAGLHKATNPLGNVQEPHAIRFDWETAKAAKTHTSNDIKNGIVWGCRFHPDGTLIAVSSGSHLLFWNATDEKPLHQFKVPSAAREMDLHADGIQIATAHHDSRVRVTKLAPKTPEKKA